MTYISFRDNIRFSHGGNSREMPLHINENVNLPCAGFCHLKSKGIEQSVACYLQFNIEHVCLFSSIVGIFVFVRQGFVVDMSLV